MIISSLYKQCCEGGTAHLEGGYKYQVEDLLQEQSWIKEAENDMNKQREELLLK